MLSHADLYHTGIVVADLPAAMEEHTRVAGTRWGLQAKAMVQVILEDGPREIEFAMAYSADGPHYVELVQAVPGTLWTTSERTRVHHLGYWCDDLVAGSAFLTAQGLPRVAKVGTFDEAEQGSAVFHLSPTGGYIELVTTALQPYLSAS